MKPTTPLPLGKTEKARKVAKADVRHLRRGYHGDVDAILPYGWGGTDPYLCIPFPSIATAKAAKRFWGMTEEEKHRALSNMFAEHGHPVNCDHLATFTLNLIAGRKK